MERKKFIPCNSFKRETYSASKHHTIMPILNSQPLYCLILLIPYPSTSKSFSPPQANAIALHYPTNTHHILPMNYTAPSHNPCIMNISKTMLLLILVKITYSASYKLKFLIHSTFHLIGNHKQYIQCMWNLPPRVRWISRMQESVVGGEEIYSMQQDKQQ